MFVCVRVDGQDATFLTFSFSYLATFFLEATTRRSGGWRGRGTLLTFACAVRRRSEEMKRQKEEEGTTSYGFVAWEPSDANDNAKWSCLTTFMLKMAFAAVRLPLSPPLPL